jgi:AraC-like DNA-binding protein
MVLAAPWIANVLTRLIFFMQIMKDTKLNYIRNERPVLHIAAEAVEEIKMFMDQRPLERIPIPDLIERVSIGKNLLHEAFKQIEGKTIVRYQLEKRMEAACNLLCEWRLNVKQVAFKCGYYDQANFTKDFKNVYKITPRQWLSQNAIKSNPTINTTRIKSL